MKNTPIRKKDFLIGLSRQILTMRKHYFLVFIIFCTILRNGVSIYGELFRGFIQYDEEWEARKVSTQNMIGSILVELGDSFGISIYLASYFLFVIVCCTLIIFEIRKLVSLEQKYAIIILSLLPAFTIILHRLGTLDITSILFSILAGLTIGKNRQFFYLILVALSHNESAFAISSTLLLLSFVPRFRLIFEEIFKSRKPLLLLLVISCGLSILNFVNLGSESKSGQLPSLLKVSLVQFFSSGYWLPYSWLGGMWLVLFGSIKKLSRDYFLFILNLIIFLGIFSVVTVDGTRVGVICLTYPLVVITKWLIHSNKIDFRYVLLALLLPAINVSNMNVFLPFRQIAHIFAVPLTYIQVS